MNIVNGLYVKQHASCKKSERNTQSTSEVKENSSMIHKLFKMNYNNNYYRVKGIEGTRY